MEDGKNIEEFFDYVPSIKKIKKVIPLYFFQVILFILVLVFFWWISSSFWAGAIIGQSFVSALLSIYFIYLAKNSDKIRQKYRHKFGKLACEKYWFHYQAYTIPFICAAFYFPLLLKTDYFLPSLIRLPSHLINNSIFPYFVALPLGIFFIIFGFMMKRPSGGYGMVYDNYIYTIYPEKSKLITKEIYQYIRNPQYLSRGIIAIGFGVIANNISAILVGFIHFISYCAIIPAEDGELYRRYGKDFMIYKERVPALFPKFVDWKKFIKIVFCRRP